MFYLMGSLTIALLRQLGCGQVEQIQEAYALPGPLSGHVLSGSPCSVYGCLWRPWHHAEIMGAHGRQGNLEITPSAKPAFLR